MTLRKYNGFAEECGDDGMMQLAVTASEGEYRTIDQWLERNYVRVRPYNHFERDSADCVHDPLYSPVGKRYRRYTFRTLNASIVGFRLSFGAPQRAYTDALFLAYCDLVIHRAIVMAVPRSSRVATKDCAANFFKRVYDWAKESGLRLVNLAEIFRRDEDLPMKGRIMFIYYPVGSPCFMSAVMFSESSDAALYKLSFAE
jgi:hypothetical protein